MTIDIRHAFTSGLSDGANAALVQPSNWNAAHDIELAADRVLGRVGTDGAAQEISLHASLTFNGTTIEVADTQSLASLSLSGSLTFGLGSLLNQGVSDQLTVLGSLRAVGSSTSSSLFAVNGSVVTEVTSVTGDAGYLATQAAELKLATAGSDDIVVLPALSEVARFNVGGGLDLVGTLGLASGAAINWASGEVTLTETNANLLTLAGGALLTTSTAIDAGTATAVSADTTPAALAFGVALYAVSNTTDANDICDLPVNTAADIGRVVRVYAVEAFEIQSADASATLNGVVIGATNEAAISAGMFVEFVCVADNTWISKAWAADGTPTQIIPDAL